VAEREAYVCGPEEFEEVVLGALSEVGVTRTRSDGKDLPIDAHLVHIILGDSIPDRESSLG
jgi:hypothetical protein